MSVPNPGGAAARVLYDFTAEDAGELSVTAGEVVLLLESTTEASDGWLFAASATNPQRTGFVPADYVSLLPAHTAGSVGGGAAIPPSTGAALSDSMGPTPKQLHFSSSPVRAEPYATDALATSASDAHNRSALASSQSSSTPAPMPLSLSSLGASLPPTVSGLSSVRAAGTQQLSSARGAGVGSGAAGLASSTALAAPNPAALASATSANHDYAQLFASHDEWFRAATTARMESYRSLQAEANDLLRGLAEAESRSTSLVARISELDNLIAEERTRWNSKNMLASAAHSVTTGSATGTR